jgi:diguanylate cyclase (GGDEF)-like protein/PAS domain S-box-containing protein
MPHTKPPTRYRLHLAEWLGLLAMLLAFGDCIAHALYPVSQLPFADFLLEPQVQAWMYGAIALSVTLSLFLFQQSRRSFLRLAIIKESALRASDARLRSFFEATPDALLISDEHGTITMANRQVEPLLGYTIKELLGMSIEELVPMHIRGIHPTKRDGFAATPSARRMADGIVVKALRKDGGECDVEVSLSRIETDDGQYFASALRDITARLKDHERIRELAFHDHLTGLPNRTLLLDRLKQAKTISGRSRNFGALLFIDMDHFKTLNDTLGHDVGDVLLKEVASRLAHCARAGDTVARLGGDEFMVVLPGLSNDAAEAAADTQVVASKILTQLKEPYQLEGVVHRCSASIGVTLFLADSVSRDELMKQADLAMYRAKEAGRNRVRFFDPSMQIAVIQRAALEKDLREAVQSNQFSLHYQAQVMDEYHIAGAEVLLRWHHPQRGQVPPVDFIPMAEETGLILPLGHWVLTTACAQLARWASQPDMAHLTVAVNVSAHQFAQVDFVEQVLAVLHNTGANPQRLKLELTESLLISNVQDTIGKMHALKAKGVGFALDDFGTGYSSLSYLSRLPLDQLKIDQSFVREVLTDPNDAAIAKTVVALAQSLGLAVIAEGVETQAQRDFLAHAGCHAYQGYLFSRPLPLEEFEAFCSQAIKVVATVV